MYACWMYVTPVPVDVREGSAAGVTNRIYFRVAYLTEYLLFYIDAFIYDRPKYFISFT